MAKHTEFKQLDLGTGVEDHEQLLTHLREGWLVVWATPICQQSGKTIQIKYILGRDK